MVCMDYTSIIFMLGMVGLLLNRRNLLLMLLSLEFTFLASAINFIFSTSIMNLFTGSLYGIFVILVVVCDTGIGLALVVVTYRSSKSISVNSLITLRG